MDKTCLLFSQPSFWEGVGRLFDWDATLNTYNDSKSSKEADYKALQSDWRAIGVDIFRAVEEYEFEK